MESKWLWLLSVFGVLGFSFAVAAKFQLRELWTYLTTTTVGKGASAGIILFVGLATLVVTLAGCSPAYSEPLTTKNGGTWFKYGEVFVGMDNTFDTSPQCREGRYSDQLTSNGGFRFNIYESHDGLFSTNLKYTHHSCFLNKDRNSYDAIGIEASYKFWVR